MRLAGDFLKTTTTFGDPMIENVPKLLCRGEASISNRHKRVEVHYDPDSDRYTVGAYWYYGDQRESGRIKGFSCGPDHFVSKLKSLATSQKIYSNQYVIL